MYRRDVASALDAGRSPYRSLASRYPHAVPEHSFRRSLSLKPVRQAGHHSRRVALVCVTLPPGAESCSSILSEWAFRNGSDAGRSFAGGGSRGVDEDRESRMLTSSSYH